MRSVPAGRLSSQYVSAMPYATAAAPQRSANRTAWSRKKLRCFALYVVGAEYSRRGVFLTHARGFVTESAA
jgi:hypothetical protein